MDPNTRALIMGAAGAGGAEKTYIEDVFSTWLYTGNGSTQTITNGIDLSGKGGMVWIKCRDLGRQHYIFDTNRGVENWLFITTNAQNNSPGSLTAFNSNGFTLGSYADTNNSSELFASWTFRKAAKFFDVVTYTGNGSNRSIAHNLGSVPGCIIIKELDVFSFDEDNWPVYHRSLANTECMFLDGTVAKTTNTALWNSTTPTSTVFSLGTDPLVNLSGRNYVAYLFAHNAGGFGDAGTSDVISCGSFTTPSSGSVTVNLGWEPQWILYKKTDSTSTQDWYMHDNMRGFAVNNSVANPVLRPNTSGAENQNTTTPQPNATGFLVSSGDFGPNVPYIYIAIRRGPMKTPTDATKVFSANVGAATGTVVTTNFPVDLAVSHYKPGGDSVYWFDRVRGANSPGVNNSRPNLRSVSTAAETLGVNGTSSWDNTSYKIDGFIGGTSYIHWTFRRAPEFFDVVAYTGTQQSRIVTHSLKKKPQLIIVKCRSNASNWIVYSETLGALKFLRLNTTDGELSNSNGDIWGYTEPTSTAFTVADKNTVTDAANFLNATYIAYLFASCPGVSKVGSYTGTGTTLSVDCGFTNGARFVLIKRTDSTGDWYVWDTARGIIANNDPYLLLNSTAAEVTNTDYIDPLNSGFQISSTAPAAINTSGGTFIYLAIA